MLDRRLKDLAAAIVFVGLLPVACSGQMMNVKIVQRQNNETGYSNFVPGHSTSTTNANVNCYAGSTNVNCSGTATTNGYSTLRFRSYCLTEGLRWLTA